MRRLGAVAIAGVIGASVIGSPGAVARAIAAEPRVAASGWAKPASTPISKPASMPSSTPSLASSSNSSPTPSPRPDPVAVDPARSPGPATGRPAPAKPAPYPTSCTGWEGSLRRARDLLANRWELASHPIVTLPANRSWNENPLSDDNWQYMDHSLMAVHSLFAAYAETSDVRYRSRASAILQDWIQDNPRQNPRSVWAWNDHSTAMRAVVLACAAEYFAPRTPWLEQALVLHGRTLADPDFYVDHGNHALNQSIGLLEVGAILGHAAWRDLAVDRIAALVSESVDVQGVTNEQSVGYQAYNLGRYQLAERRIRELGLPVPAAFERVARMAGFLAHATLPNGQYEMLGDTDRRRAMSIPGTWAEYAATQGASGPRPPATLAVYRAGFLFARTGWGTARPPADETFLSLRWGPAPFIHGHADGGSVTLYGAGSRLLIDPGKYTYNRDPYRWWFKGRSAHNVVTVDGVRWDATASTSLLNHSNSTTMVNARVRMTGYAGVVHDRNVTFSRRLGYVLVDDRLRSSSPRTFRQLWHLTDDGKPDVHATWFRSQRSRGNVQVRQLLGGTTSRVVRGRTSPIQGWLAWNHGQRIAAPVVEVARSGSNARYLTLLVTAPGQPSSTVSGLSLTASGYSVVVTVGGKSERVVVSGSSATVTPLN